ncbi:dihydrofolate reductase family protein [Natronococcus wangiae]|uniref:dihydrofolate reductase family protein n=1 Tax=Natronococcus wangiae TaxID=3068275 RepID=UPI003133BD14
MTDGGTTFTFVTDGTESAVERAKEAAGDGDVSIAGGANAVQQCLEAGLLDELRIHLVPLLLGDGIRSFARSDGAPIELERTRAVASAAVTHLRYRVGERAEVG